MKRQKFPGYPGLFIDDIDPYAAHGETGLPAPTSVELDTEEAWNDFQESVAAFAADTVPPLTDPKPDEKPGPAVPPKPGVRR